MDWQRKNNTYYFKCITGSIFSNEQISKDYHKFIISHISHYEKTTQIYIVSTEITLEKHVSTKIQPFKVKIRTPISGHYSHNSTEYLLKRNN